MIAPRATGLKSHRFRTEREDDWLRLERMLRKAETRSAAALTDDELVQLPVLYRAALSALSSARATSLDHALVEYLESLCERAYYFLYGVRGRPGERFIDFLARKLPAAVKGLWRETLISGGLFALGVAVAYLLVSNDPDWFQSLMGGDAQGRGPQATAEELRKIIYNDTERSGLSVFATFLFTHNAYVSLLAFALGFALCVPTAYLMLSNGAGVGALLAVHVDKGLGFELGGWLAIHGVGEIFACILSGAAGLRIGWSVGFPGERSRLDALRESGVQGAVVMGGVVMMLLFAGLLEGFGRQLITNDLARYGIGAATGVFWACYYYLPRRGKAGG